MSPSHFMASLHDLTFGVGSVSRSTSSSSAGESGDDWSSSAKKEFSQLSPSISTHTGRSSSSSVEMCSYVREYHAYKDIWDSVVGQQLLLKREPNNPEDLHAVAVLDEKVVVGHVPYNLAPISSLFLRGQELC